MITPPIKTRQYDDDGTLVIYDKDKPSYVNEIIALIKGSNTKGCLGAVRLGKTRWVRTLSIDGHILCMCEKLYARLYDAICADDELLARLVP